MSWFPFSRKNKPASEQGSDGFYSRSEQEPTVARSRAKRSGAGIAKREPADPALSAKKRARRRLVGAVALVLALVIGLPMVLDSEPKPLATDISIQIPSKNKTVAPQPATPAAVPAKPAGLDVAEEVIDPPQPTPAGSDAAAAVPVAAKPLPKDQSATPERTPQLALTQPSAIAEAKDKHTAQAVPAAPAARLEDARARAILEGKFSAPATPPKVADGNHGKFVVQVAALASADKVSELRGKLTHAGIASYTQKVATASGERIRVRVGPFASKGEAEQMRSRLGKLGLNGTLVPA